MSYSRFVGICESQFPDIITAWIIKSNKLRLFIIDGSYMDVWFSVTLANRFAYHWERRLVDGSIYRLDNRPHQELISLSGYPVHFHNGVDSVVEESTFSIDLEAAFIEFLEMVRQRVGNTKSEL